LALHVIWKENQKAALYEETIYSSVVLNGGESVNEPPKLQDYMLPILKLFADGEEHIYKEIPAFLEAGHALLEADKPDRARVMINSAIGYFVKALILDKTGHQRFKITDRGLELLEKRPESITVQDLGQFKEFNTFIQSRYKKTEKFDSDETPGSIVPEDAMDSAYQVHKESLADELLEKVKQGTWKFFEMLVKDLLVHMGYGDPYDERQFTQKPADGGIDGIIQEDKLGLDIICIQAKKWENPVGRPEIQKFAGSLESKHAKKGVFITTSNFTAEAQEYVLGIEKKIVLIDGKRLSELMIDYDVGVGTLKTYELKQVDNDYFLMA
jgi:restriction system protein